MLKLFNQFNFSGCYFGVLIVGIGKWNLAWWTLQLGI